MKIFILILTCLIQVSMAKAEVSKICKLKLKESFDYFYTSSNLNDYDNSVRVHDGAILKYVRDTPIIYDDKSLEGVEFIVLENPSPNSEWTAKPGQHVYKYKTMFNCIWSESDISPVPPANPPQDKCGQYKCRYGFYSTGDKQSCSHWWNTPLWFCAMGKSRSGPAAKLCPGTYFF